MGFPSNDLQRQFEAIDYRLGLALYGACGFLLSTWLTKSFDPRVYDLAAQAGHVWKPVPPFYFGGQRAYWLAVAIFLFLLIAPKLGQKIPTSLNRNSLSYGLLVVFVYFCLTCISLIIFGLSGALMVQFIGYSFIIGSTEFLRGFEFDFSFAGDRSILREARIEKIRLLYRKWFSGISALITVSIAICITAALKLFDIAREDLGKLASEALAQMLGATVIYAGIGLTLGPFAQMFGILEKIENQLEHIEAEEKRTKGLVSSTGECSRR
jgi:hypothetical protein